jgi:hypothetical protein
MAVQPSITGKIHQDQIRLVVLGHGNRFLAMDCRQNPISRDAKHRNQHGSIIDMIINHKNCHHWWTFLGNDDFPPCSRRERRGKPHEQDVPRSGIITTHFTPQPLRAYHRGVNHVFSPPAARAPGLMIPPLHSRLAILHTGRSL